jgi:hypothetical protein
VETKAKTNQCFLHSGRRVLKVVDDKDLKLLPASRESLLLLVRVSFSLSLPADFSLVRLAPFDPLAVPLYFAFSSPIPLQHSNDASAHDRQ